MTNHGGAFEQATELVLEIQAGEGGEDSKNFVGELFSAYVRYSESLSLEVEIIDSTSGNIKAIVTGRGAGQAFIHEPGKHVCQRVPVTESKGRRQTSYVSVSVLPLEKDAQVQLLDAEVGIEPCNLGGPGGQHRNKTMSDVRVTHKPTGIQVVMGGRKYHQNLAQALKTLSERVKQKHASEARVARSEARRGQMGGGTRGDKVRTYNFLRNEIVDHRLNKRGNPKKVMKGDFSFLR